MNDFKKLLITLEEIKAIRVAVFGERYKAKSRLLTKREIRKISKFIDQTYNSNLIIRDFNNMSL